MMLMIPVRPKSKLHLIMGWSSSVVACSGLDNSTAIGRELGGGIERHCFLIVPDNAPQGTSLLYYITSDANGMRVAATPLSTTSTR